MGDAAAKSIVGLDDVEFSTLYREHADYVWRTCRRLGVAAGDVSDAAHDVFVVAFRLRGSFDPARPAKPWLFGIARRVAADRRRKQGRVLLGDFGSGTEAPDATNRIALQDAMSSLPELLLEAFVLFDLEGYSAPEVASMVGKPINTVYSRVRLAREQLCKLMGGSS